MADKEYPLGEEIANSITHGIGWAFGIAALVVLVVLSAIYGNVWHIVSSAIYGTSMILLYASSTMYHSLTNRTAKNVFKVLDHSSIYLLIAGSYTPIMLVYLRDGWGWPILIFVWGATVLGIVFKSIWIDRFKALSLTLYIVMGWCIMVAIPSVMDKVPLGALVLILEGGIAYTVGVPFYVAKDRPYFHAIWHVMVLGGTLFQFFGILLFVIPVL